MPGHRGIFLLGQNMCVCVCAWKGGGGSGGAEWDQEDGLVDFNWKISPASEETVKSHPWSNFDKKKKKKKIHFPTSLCPFHKTCSDKFGFYSKLLYLGCSSNDDFKSFVPSSCVYQCFSPEFSLCRHRFRHGVIWSGFTLLVFASLTGLAETNKHHTPTPLPLSSSHTPKRKKKRFLLCQSTQGSMAWFDFFLCLQSYFPLLFKFLAYLKAGPKTLTVQV